MGHVKVQNLGKAYKQYPNRWSRLAEWVVPWPSAQHPLRWVLQDVNFEIQAGESLGIVGLNGAGKSTLLKLISGLTQATTGSAEVGGSVAALLELGMGFHPGFTGRQNVVMASQLRGLGLDAIAQLMPAIEAFAEIGDYMDQPFRTYSSGMQMRLAFSVATAVRPDVLIVDEALSVGDSYFQHKSFARIRQFRERGTTLLVVSHDRYAIQTICDRALLLHGGRQAHFGPAQEVLDIYHAMLGDVDKALIRQERSESGHLQVISGNGEAQILGVELLDEAGQPTAAVETASHAVLLVRARARQALAQVVVGFLIKDRLGQAVYGVNTLRLGETISGLAPGEEFSVRVALQMNLGKGSYSVSLALTAEDSHLADNYEWRDHALVFHVLNTRHPDFVGSTFLEPEIEVSRQLAGCDRFQGAGVAA